jgi:hypothetical protein
MIEISFNKTESEEENIGKLSFFVLNVLKAGAENLEINEFEVRCTVALSILCNLVEDGYVKTAMEVVEDFLDLKDKIEVPEENLILN